MVAAAHVYGANVGIGAIGKESERRAAKKGLASNHTAASSHGDDGMLRSFMARRRAGLGTAKAAQEPVPYMVAASLGKSALAYPGSSTLWSERTHNPGMKDASEVHLNDKLCPELSAARQAEKGSSTSITLRDLSALSQDESFHAPADLVSSANLAARRGPSSGGLRLYADAAAAAAPHGAVKLSLLPPEASGSGSAHGRSITAALERTLITDAATQTVCEAGAQTDAADDEQSSRERVVLVPFGPRPPDSVPVIVPTAQLAKSKQGGKQPLRPKQRPSAAERALPTHSKATATKRKLTTGTVPRWGVKTLDPYDPVVQAHKVKLSRSPPHVTKRDASGFPRAAPIERAQRASAPSPHKSARAPPRLTAKACTPKASARPRATSSSTKSRASQSVRTGRAGRSKAAAALEAGTAAADSDLADLQEHLHELQDLREATFSHLVQPRASSDQQQRQQRAPRTFTVPDADAMIRGSVASPRSVTNTASEPQAQSSDVTFRLSPPSPLSPPAIVTDVNNAALRAKDCEIARGRDDTEQPRPRSASPQPTAQAQEQSRGDPVSNPERVEALTSLERALHDLERDIIGTSDKPRQCGRQQQQQQYGAGSEHADAFSCSLNSLAALEAEIAAQQERLRSLGCSPSTVLGSESPPGGAQHAVSSPPRAGAQARAVYARGPGPESAGGGAGSATWTSADGASSSEAYGTPRQPVRAPAYASGSPRPTPQSTTAQSTHRDMPRAAGLAASPAPASSRDAVPTSPISIEERLRRLGLSEQISKLVKDIAADTESLPSTAAERDSSQRPQQQGAWLPVAVPTEAESSILTLPTLQGPTGAAPPFSTTASSVTSSVLGDLTQPHTRGTVATIAAAANASARVSPTQFWTQHAQGFASPQAVSPVSPMPHLTFPTSASARERDLHASGSSSQAPEPAHLLGMTSSTAAAVVGAGDAAGSVRSSLDVQSSMRAASRAAHTAYLESLQRPSSASPDAGVPRPASAAPQPHADVDLDRDLSRLLRDAETFSEQEAHAAESTGRGMSRGSEQGQSLRSAIDATAALSASFSFDTAARPMSEPRSTARSSGQGSVGTEPGRAPAQASAPGPTGEGTEATGAVLVPSSVSSMHDASRTSEGSGGGATVGMLRARQAADAAYRAEMVAVGDLLGKDSSWNGSETVHSASSGAPMHDYHNRVSPTPHSARGSAHGSAGASEQAPSPATPSEASYMAQDAGLSQIETPADLKADLDQILFGPNSFWDT